MKKIKTEIFCTSCGYIMDVELKMYARIDCNCPRCEKKKISEFETIRTVEEE